MILSDKHVHSTFSDGKNPPEELILEALNRGMTTLGFSDHAYTSFDDDFCMPEANEAPYRAAIRSLQEKYRDKIEILLGMEQDFYSDHPAKDLDYIIGSAHYIYVDGVYVSVDWTADIQLQAVQDHFDGDYYAFSEAYFDEMSHMYEQTNCDIVGHFDLLSIFSEKRKLFDPKEGRYRKAWQKALDELLKAPVSFEINTGAISRGYRTVPYPSFEMIDYIKERGGKLVLSSDSHIKENLMYGFDRFESLL